MTKILIRHHQLLGNLQKNSNSSARKPSQLKEATSTEELPQNKTMKKALVTMITMPTRPKMSSGSHEDQGSMTMVMTMTMAMKPIKRKKTKRNSRVKVKASPKKVKTNKMTHK